MRWSKLKKRTEALFAPCVRGRVELRATTYRRAADKMGRGYITIDGEEAWNAPDAAWWAKERDKIAHVAGRDGLTPPQAQPLAWDELAREGVHSLGGFYVALEKFCDGDVEANLRADDVLLRALAMCDRRVGKRRLAAMEVEGEHPLVQRLYELRIEAEGLRRRQAVPE